MGWMHKSTNIYGISKAILIFLHKKCMQKYTKNLIK